VREVDYSDDEALRIVGVAAMFEGNTYRFRVNNSEGRFLVMLESHEFPQGFFEHNAVCCKYNTDPCAHASRDIKDAIRCTIAEHNARFHFLKEVK